MYRNVILDFISNNHKTLISNEYLQMTFVFLQFDVDDLGKLIDLNDSEKEGIKQFSQGEALFVCGNRRMQINVAVTKDELDSFGSGGGY